MKPTLGHPTRIAAICALRAEGKTENQIAAAIGIRPGTVTSIECRARRRHTVGKGGAHYLRISGVNLGDLCEEAQRRGYSPTRLAERIIRVVATDSLFDAVLDQ